MADERGRRIEREYAGDGDPTAEARHLLERVRAGALARDRLELAAYAGHPAALLALGQDPTPDMQVAEAFVRGLGKWADALDCAQDCATHVALAGLRESPIEDHQTLARECEAFMEATRGAEVPPFAGDLLGHYAVEAPDSTGSAADVCGWFLVSRTLFARQHVPAAAEFSRIVAGDVAALAAAMGDGVLAEIKKQIVALALR